MGGASEKRWSFLNSGQNIGVSKKVGGAAQIVGGTWDEFQKVYGAS